MEATVSKLVLLTSFEVLKLLPLDCCSTSLASNKRRLLNQVVFSFNRG